MINFDFFDVITLEWLMVSACNLVCGCFINLRRQKNFDFIDFLVVLLFGCPTDHSRLLYYRNSDLTFSLLIAISYRLK